MYCKNCGAPSETELCPNCAAQQQYQQYQQPQQYQDPYQQQYQQPQQYQDPYQQQYQQPQYQAPQQPQYQAPQQPQYQAPRQPQGDPLKANWHTILAVLGAVALIFGLLTVFGVMEINATVEMNGRELGSGSGNVYDVDGEMGGTWLMIGTILFSLTSLAAGAIGILYFLKVAQNKPFYDQYIGNKLGKLTPAFVMGALVVIGAVLQVVLFMLAGGSEEAYGVESSYSYGVNIITWIMLVVFGALAAVDKFMVNKEQ